MCVSQGSCSALTKPLAHAALPTSTLDFSLKLSLKSEVLEIIGRHAASVLLQIHHKSQLTSPPPMFPSSVVESMRASWEEHMHSAEQLFRISSLSFLSPMPAACSPSSLIPREEISSFYFMAACSNDLSCCLDLLSTICLIHVQMSGKPAHILRCCYFLTFSALCFQSLWTLESDMKFSYNLGPFCCKCLGNLATAPVNLTTAAPLCFDYLSVNFVQVCTVIAPQKTLKWKLAVCRTILTMNWW